MILLLAGGCSLLNDTFTVEIVDEVPVLAELRLCGSTTAFKPVGARISGARSIDCDGAGDLLVRLENAAPVSCPIGYVTPNAGQAWEFRIENGICRPLTRAPDASA